MENNTTISNTDQQQNEQSKFTLREIVFKYLAYLPLFILSLAICVGAGIIYIRYKVPVYKASASMLVKSGEDNNVVSSSSNSNDLITTALFGGKRVNLDNEIELIRSKTNLARVVEKHGLNMSYYIEGSIKKTNMYHSCPFELIPIRISDSTRNYPFNIKDITTKGGTVYYKRPKSIHAAETRNFKWNDTISMQGMLFTLRPKASVTAAPVEAEDQNATYFYDALWQPTMAVAGEIKGALGIGALNAKTTIIQLSLITGNTEEGKDILDAIIKEYNQQNIDEKNKVAANTIRFIEERLALVTSELEGVEGELKDYRNKYQILDLEKQSEAFFADYRDNQKAIDLLGDKMRILHWLQKYLQDEANKDRLVPTNLGIEDLTLVALVAKYNELQLQKQSLQPTVLSNERYLAAATAQLEELRKNLLVSLANLEKNYLDEQGALKRKEGDYNNYLSSVPQKQRALQEILRQQNIKQGLYLYLLQKREETAIAAASTVSNYQQIDPAEASSVPIEPKSGNIKMFTILLGILIPVTIIYVLDLLNDKVTTREDIVRKISRPIVGEISHVDKSMSSIVVGQSRNMIAEQFRILRSNLQFLTDKAIQPKIYLVSSSISGEGKSFISLNLAAVLSLSGKKVALLEFDLRKMRGGVYSGEKQNSKGITNYLIGQTDNPGDIITTVEHYPDLNIFRSGPIPPNPGELVMSDKVKVLFDWLKERYDYIVIDSAPVGLVSDSFALVDYSHVVLYVLRQRYTYKRQLDFLNDVIRQDKLRNVSLVVNDVQMGGKYGYYGYGYGYGYGYIYRYGFGYRYGYGAYGKKYFGKSNEGYFDLPNKK